MTTNVAVMTPPRGAAASDGLRHTAHPLVLRVHAMAPGQPPGVDAAAAALDAARIDGIVHEPVGAVLHVYATTETAATAAIRALTQGDGARFDVFGPEVRYLDGSPPLEPVMAVELDLPLLFGGFVRREILRRRGTVTATAPARRTVALHAEVPLAALLGFPRWIEALTDGRAQLRTALARYAPLRPEHDPEPRAA